MADNERLERLAAQKKVLGEVAAWAQQTISFAIGLRARDSGKPFEGPDDIDISIGRCFTIHLLSNIT